MTPPRIQSSRPTALLTGAAGFIGSHLARALVGRGDHVIALDCAADARERLRMHRLAEHVSLINDRVENLSRLRSIFEMQRVEVVYHLAAQTIVGEALADPFQTYESNIRGTYALLEACRALGDESPRVIIASSDKAYGASDKLPYVECMALRGGAPYDVSKSCCDLLAQSFAATYAIPIAIARCGNVYGPGDFHDTRIVSGTIRSLLRGERPIVRSDGTPRRDYLHVEDAVRGFLALDQWLLRDDAPSHAERAFNFATGQPMSVLEVIDALRIAMGCTDLEPVIQNCSRAEIQDQHLDSARARTLLGWRPVRDFAGALPQIIEWYRRHPSVDGQITALPSRSIEGKPAIRELSAR